MPTINLLPVRLLRKRARSKRELSLMGIFFIAICALFFLLSLYQGNTIANLQSNIKSLAQQRASYGPILRKIAKLKKQKLELERKTEVIATLKKDSSLVVHTLDEVARAVDSKRMWLSSLKQSGGSLQLSGVALDNRTVSDFMNTLKRSPFIQSVSLSSASLHKVEGRNLKKFSLHCSVAVPKKKATKKP